LIKISKPEDWDPEIDFLQYIKNKEETQVNKISNSHKKSFTARHGHGHGMQ